MRVFVLGGTGSIGSPILRELRKRGHEVWALARSDVSATKLRDCGATPVEGDIAAPERWTARLPPIDAVIHAACDFAAEMGAIDARLLDGLRPSLAAQPKRPRFIYTGGCWLFGATGDEVATKKTPFRPLAAFAWMVPHLARILTSPEVDGIVIHPAMVYTADGGVFWRFAREATERNAIRVVASEAIRWPLVHAEDSQVSTFSHCERAPARSSYIGAAIDRVSVDQSRAPSQDVSARGIGNADRLRRCNRSRTRRMGERVCARPATERRQSAARTRLAAKTSRSGR